MSSPSLAMYNRGVSPVTTATWSMGIRGDEGHMMAAGTIVMYHIHVPSLGADMKLHRAHGAGRYGRNKVT